MLYNINLKEVIYTKYMDINPKIKILLEQEKKNFIKENSIGPIAYFSDEDGKKCYIITAPWECEAMQIVGEFSNEPSLKNLTNTYAIVGDQALDIEKRIFLRLINQSFYLGINDQEKLKAIYRCLLLNCNSPDYNSYINYCKKIRTIKSDKTLMIKNNSAN